MEIRLPMEACQESKQKLYLEANLSACFISMTLYLHF